METSNEINELISAVKENCPDIVISQLTNFEKKAIESGVWKFWHKDNEDTWVIVEILEGMLCTLYSNKEFKDKYPINSSKICDFLNKIN